MIRFWGHENFLAMMLSWLMAATIGITVHEFAHAMRADKAGDPTPRINGRLTLNPLAHYDFIGTTMLLLLGLGWAKPVPTNPLNFRRPRYDSIMVAAWGAIANIITAGVFAIVWRLLRGANLAAGYDVLFSAIVWINLILAFFNLIPVAPLDGSHILLGLLPTQKAIQLEAFYQRFGVLLLFGVVFFGWRFIIFPVLLIYLLLTGAPGLYF
ncbi:MAG: site-2 protease family protein [Armatimonadota bacterium]